MIYLAPEILQGEVKYDDSADIYSFAMIAYQILTNKTPFYDQNLLNDQQTLRNKIISGHRPVFSELITQKMQDLLSKCWNKIPELCPTFANIFDILSNDFSYSSESIDNYEIKNYLSMMEESKKLQQISSNDITVSQQIKDLKATIFTCFSDNFKYSHHPNSYRANLYLEEAAKFDGEKALITLGDSYYKNRNYVDAKQFYEREAKQGNTYALKKLGDMFIGGQGVQKGYSKAKEYYEEAARKGCLEAMKSLGDIYFYGFGVEKDFSRAVYVHLLI